VLKTELPAALTQLQRSNIAPVDLAQAAIGPGMAVYTRYAKVLDAEGKPLLVREALALINQALDEALAEQEGDFDAGSRWALAWFEQHGFAEGEFGVAETQRLLTLGWSLTGQYPANGFSSRPASRGGSAEARLDGVLELVRQFRPLCREELDPIIHIGIMRGRDHGPRHRSQRPREICHPGRW
jgi:hypothetical protein